MALLIAVVLLQACEQPASPPPPKTSAVQPQPAPAPVPAVSKVAPAAAKPMAPAKPAAKPVTATQSKPVVVAPKPKPKEPKVPLDLSLDSDVFDELSLDSDDTIPSTLLPPLFGEKVAPASPFQLHGKLITNDRTDSYLDSVEGAALQFEFKN